MENNSTSNTNNKASLLTKVALSTLQFVDDNNDLIECNNNNNRSIDDKMIPELCEWLIILNGKVKTLNLLGNEITSKGASILFDVLRTEKLFVKQVRLNWNEQIDNNFMKSLGECLKSNKNVEQIDMGYNKISDVGVEILAPYLHGNSTFRMLDFGFNRGITDKSIPSLLKMIESSHILGIGFANTSITQNNVFATCLACNQIKTGVNKLNLADKNLSDESLISICEQMKKYGIDKLKVISFERNRITSKGASLLFDTLRECNSVVSTLDISYNKTDDDCIKQLGECIQDNESLEELRLGGNKITDKGIKILSEFLFGNTKLQSLNLSENNEVTDASVPNLMDIIKKSCLSSISMAWTSISDENQDEIKLALKIPIDQREIPIKSSTKSAAKISAST